MYWASIVGPLPSPYKVEFMPYLKPAASRDVETTSYALLTYAQRGEIDRAVPILKWLGSRQTAQGGFGSTQV